MNSSIKLFIGKPRPHRAVAFTLVEMLVVMGIIAVLLATLLPALKGLNQGLGRHGAVNTLLGTLDRARMLAISDGRATYVVFATPTATGDGKKLKPELWGRAYAIYEDHDNLSFTPEQRTPWLQLPNTLALKMNDGGADDGSGPYASVTNQPLSVTTDPTFPISAGVLPPGAAGTTSVLLPYWKFDVTGAVSIPSGLSANAAYKQPLYLRVLLFPGFLDPTKPNGVEVSTQTVGGVGGNNSAGQFEEVDLMLATGRAKYNVNPAYNLATPPPPP